MNYDSLNEIFSAGTERMSCLFQDSGSYDGGSYAVNGAEYARYNGGMVSNIYAHGDSYWGFNADSVHLRVDNRDTRMRSLYREEGTLYGYYRFLKIRWEGWAHYNSSGNDYQLKYDLIFWDTGDISLHMVQIPLFCYDGSFNFIADRTYEYKKPTVDAPDVTFHYDAENKIYEIKYMPLDLLVPFRVLVKDAGNVLYTVENQVINEETGDREDILVPLEETELTAYLFKTRGFEKMPEWNLIKGLDMPSVLSWSADRAFPLTAVITGTPPKQYVECTADLSDGTVLGIKALNAEYTGDVTAQYSYDGEKFTEEASMADFLMTDLDAMYEGLTEERCITFRFWLSGDAALTGFVMNYRNGDDDDGK